MTFAKTVYVSRMGLGPRCGRKRIILEVAAQTSRWARRRNRTLPSKTSPHCDREAPILFYSCSLLVNIYWMNSK